MGLFDTIAEGFRNLTGAPLVYPGSRLHAKLGATPNDVVVDWVAGAAS